MVSPEGATTEGAANVICNTLADQFDNAIVVIVIGGATNNGEPIITDSMPPTPTTPSPRGSIRRVIT